MEEGGRRGIRWIYSGGGGGGGVGVVFFFQAEDGIRDIGVTGVQTCALPIWRVVRGENICKWPSCKHRRGSN